MKRVLIILLAAGVIAGVAAAQEGYGRQQSSTGQRVAQSGAGQSGTQSQSVGQGQSQTGAQQQAQSSAPQQGSSKQPQAKSQDEYKSFMDAVQKNNPADAEQTAREFEAKYPQSELLSMLYQQVMTKYQQADNAEKTVEMGRKSLQFDPDNTVALVMTGTVIAERTRESDIDRDEKLAEAQKDVDRALQTIQQNTFRVAPNATPDQVQSFKNTVIFMADAARGQMELVKKNDAAAEQDFRKALEVPQGQQDALTWLRLSLALDHQNKYADALTAANKAAELSASNPQVGNLAKIEQSRLRQLTGNGANKPAQQTQAPNKPETTTVKQ